MTRFPAGTVVNDNFIQKNIVLLNVYYDDLASVHYTEIPEISLDNLISIMGGNLGLFLGISFLSSIEFIELFFELIRIYFLKKKNIVTKIEKNLKFSVNAKV